MLSPFLLRSPLIYENKHIKLEPFQLFCCLFCYSMRVTINQLQQQQMDGKQLTVAENNVLESNRQHLYWEYQNLSFS